ncbi:hypothetical protein L0657_12080 [Dyadobacter sp. CY345]|uniref:hypothetical protein n=1 Tax=Dyadobacter sp. CY345 TaxID=2909335 RepID=UPI001F1A9B23|nr:hypothetical protein [Dyadobacter sp. CY345]MCF2444698.1 hypothetical protein [Dyadobacter sp. CY345]
MESFEFENTDLVSMSCIELEETIGGVIWPILWPILAAGLLAGVIADWDDFKAGLSGECPKK